MSEQNNDNLSQFFRKAVQKPKIKYLESDWEKLQAKLDDASVVGVQKPNHWKTAFIVAVALLFVSTSLLLYTSRQVDTLIGKSKIDENKVNALTKSSTSVSKNEMPIVEGTGETIRPDEGSKNSFLYDGAKKSIKTPSNKIASKKIDQHPDSFQNDKVNDRALLLNDVVNSRQLSQNAVTLDNNVSKTITMNQSPDEIIGQTLSSDSSSLEKQKEVMVKSKANLSDSLIETITTKPSRWNVMFSLSPDFSATEFDKFSTPGSAFGIAAYYAINNRLSISAGLVKSNKFYWDNGNEYKPSQAGYWAKKTNGIVPAKIDGSCSVLEIPIGLQYYVITAKKSKLYLASTFSSYIMLNESYHYTFDTPNPGAAESWNAKKTSTYSFNIANLAVGYELSISNRMMIGVAPYFKIPLSSIGSWTNIKLYSTGAAFTLRYQFQKKKKPGSLIPAD
jgi:hypothetical protein